MNAKKLQRNIGIIGDARTDIIIFSKIVRCILTEDTDQEFIDCNIIELQRQKIFHPIQDYLQAEKNNSKLELSISDNNYQIAVTKVARTLYQGFNDFAREVDPTCNCDILVLTTDSERVLTKPDDYFTYGGIKLFQILSEAVIRFYGMLLYRGYLQEYIPLVLPIVTFPSTEIIIAAAKGWETTKYYDKRPRELKDMIYGISNLARLSDKYLQDKALNFITLDGIKKVFNNIPESRDFIQRLSCYKVSCFL